MSVPIVNPNASAWLAALSLAWAAGCAHRTPATGTATVAVEPIAAGVLLPRWYAGGLNCAGRPEFQIHAYNNDFYILRQAACTNFEKPFLYMLFGQDRALLLDTGAGKVNVSAAVQSVIDSWMAKHDRSSIDLVVAPTHGHGDHVGGDSQFVGRPGITLVSRDTAAVRSFFQIRRWPDDIVQYDLGGRVLDIIPIPGHEPASIAVYDRRTAILLTGDTFYPGRLYVRDTAAYARSIRRLVNFVRDRPVAYILGTHIENTRTPYVDYPVGTVDQPDEHVLELSRLQLLQLDSVVAHMRGRFSRTALADFTVWPVTP